MSIIDKKGINVTSGFKLISPQPIDARQVVDDETELQSIIDNGGAYEGQLVYVKGIAKYMKYNGTAYEEFTTGGGSSEWELLGTYTDATVTDTFEVVFEPYTTSTPINTSNYNEFNIVFEVAGLVITGQCKNVFITDTNVICQFGTNLLEMADYLGSNYMVSLLLNGNNRSINVCGMGYFDSSFNRATFSGTALATLNYLASITTLKIYGR